MFTQHASKATITPPQKKFKVNVSQISSVIANLKHPISSDPQLLDQWLTYGSNWDCMSQEESTLPSWQNSQRPKSWLQTVWVYLNSKPTFFV